MGWHFMSWPGKAVLLGSPGDNVYAGCLNDLRLDYMAFKRARTVGETNAYVAGLFATSPFHTRLMRELVAILYTPVILSW